MRKRGFPDVQVDGFFFLLMCNCSAFFLLSNGGLMMGCVSTVPCILDNRPRVLDLYSKCWSFFAYSPWSFFGFFRSMESTFVTAKCLLSSNHFTISSPPFQFVLILSVAFAQAAHAAQPSQFSHPFNTFLC